MVTSSLPPTSSRVSTNVTLSLSGCISSATAPSLTRTAPFRNATTFSYAPKDVLLNTCVTRPTNGPIFPLLFPAESVYNKRHVVPVRFTRAGASGSGLSAQMSARVREIASRCSSVRSVPLASPAAARSAAVSAVAFPDDSSGDNRTGCFSDDDGTCVVPLADRTREGGQRPPTRLRRTWDLRTVGHVEMETVVGRVDARDGDMMGACGARACRACAAVLGGEPRGEVTVRTRKYASKIEL